MQLETTMWRPTINRLVHCIYKPIVRPERKFNKLRVPKKLEEAPRMQASFVSVINDVKLSTSYYFIFIYLY
jgi:hypothetical protein